jgi:hypothetical protein
MDVRPYTKAIPFQANCIMVELSHHLNERFILFTNDRNDVRTETKLVSGARFKGALHFVIRDNTLPPANL